MIDEAFKKSVVELNRKARALLSPFNMYSCRIAYQQVCLLVSAGGESHLNDIVAHAELTFKGFMSVRLIDTKK